MVTLNAFTNGFAGLPSSVSDRPPRTCRWVYYQREFDGITIFNNGHIFEIDPQAVQSKYKVAWLQESKALRPEMYAEITSRAHLFDAVLTHDLDLIVTNPSRYRACPRMGIHLAPDQWGLYPKSKGVAMLVSDKTETVGHKLRHELMNTLHGVDFYGRDTPAGYVDKRDTLKDYAFVIVIEASREGLCFTEHLLDVIALGCVPIYWGTEYVDKFLDPTGIIPIRATGEVQSLVDYLNGDLEFVYQDMSRGIENNFNRLPEYEFTEDWFLAHALQDML